MLLRNLIPWASLLVAAPVHSHHSLAIYSAETTTIEGDVVGVQWTNPHVSIQVRVEGAAVWNLEGGSLMTLQRAGVTRDVVPTGARVKAAIRPSRRDPLVAGVTNILLPDGRELQMLTGAPAFFTTADRVIRGADTVPIDTAGENRGVFRVWSVPAPNPVRAAALADLPYAPAAVAARASFDLYDNFATRCEPEGMPRVMFNPHPFEFLDEGATIALKTELYDTVRTVYMDRAAPPADAVASRLGYSVGKWEGSTLVVTTSLVNWPYFDNAGTPQSGAVRIVERFTPSDDQSRLDFEMTVTDPTTFTAPAVIRGHWLALGGTIPRYDCQPSAGRTNE
jgi:hypothetical protein